MVAGIVFIPNGRIVPGTVFGADTYSQIVGASGTLSTFPYLLVLGGLLGSYIRAHMIRSRIEAVLDGSAMILAFAVLTSILLNHLLGGSVTAKWFGYAPGTGPRYNPMWEVNLWIFVRVGAGSAALLWASGVASTLWLSRSQANLLDPAVRFSVGGMAVALAVLAPFALLSGSALFWTLNAPFAVGAAGHLVEWSQEEWVFDGTNQVVLSMFVLAIVVLAGGSEVAVPSRIDRRARQAAIVSFCSLGASPAIGWIRLARVSLVDPPIELVVVSIATVVVVVLTAKALWRSARNGQPTGIAAIGLLLMTIVHLGASWSAKRPESAVQVPDTYYLSIGQTPWFLGAPMFGAITGAFIFARERSWVVHRLLALLGVVGFLLGAAAILASSLAVGDVLIEPAQIFLLEADISSQLWLAIGDAGLALIVAGFLLCLFSLVTPRLLRQLPLETSP